MSCPTAQCIKRLGIELKKLSAEPDPAFTVAADPQNILRCYFVMNGPEGTVYSGGRYVGLLEIPQDYPFKPPSVQLCTPSGRFRTGMAICLSNSSYHPEQWSPMWGLRTILVALVSFFVSNEATTGSVDGTDAERRKFASSSRHYNVHRIQAVYKRVLPAAYAEDAAFLKKQEGELQAENGEKGDGDDGSDGDDGDAGTTRGGGKHTREGNATPKAGAPTGGTKAAPQRKGKGAKGAKDAESAEDADPPTPPCAGKDEMETDGTQGPPLPFMLAAKQSVDIVFRLNTVSWRRWVSVAVLVVVSLMLLEQVR